MHDNIKNISNITSDAWRKISEKRALEAFHNTASRVPAYKDFLRKNRIRPGKITTIEDFYEIPYTDKVNYFKNYPLKDLVLDGDLSKAVMVARSSGSSGVPFYWPSNDEQSEEVADFYRIVFEHIFGMEKEPSLVIIGYGMGSWVAGTATLLAISKISKDLPLSVVTPGYNKSEIVEIINNLGKDYKKVVLAAYPPLVKEVVDLAKLKKVDIGNDKMRFIFGAESITEELRDYLSKAVEAKDPLRFSVNTIGTADAMVLGHETPTSIAIRKFIINEKQLVNEIFGNGRYPTLAQYYPWQKHYSIENDELLITSFSNILPLVRYNIHDNAIIYSHVAINKMLSDFGKTVSDFPPSLAKGWQLPYIGMYGKSDNTVKFYGAFVYPENIKYVLDYEENPKHYSGKFLIRVEADADLNQVLYIDIELAEGVKSSESLKESLTQELVHMISEKNTEYKCVLDDIEEKAIPNVNFIQYGSEEFKVDIKHSYAKK